MSTRPSDNDIRGRVWKKTVEPVRRVRQGYELFRGCDRTPRPAVLRPQRVQLAAAGLRPSRRQSVPEGLHSIPHGVLRLYSRSNCQTVLQLL